MVLILNQVKEIIDIESTKSIDIDKTILFKRFFFFKIR